jgi:hypothetical protein
LQDKSITSITSIFVIDLCSRASQNATKQGVLQVLCFDGAQTETVSSRDLQQIIRSEGDQTPHYTTITRWIADFDSGRRTSLSDSFGADHGRPVSASGDDQIALVKQILDDDPRLSTREIEAVS